MKKKEKVRFVKKATKINLIKVKYLIRNQHNNKQHKALLEQHKEDLTTQANAHSSVLVKMKATAKAKANDDLCIQVKMKETAKTKVESV